MHFRGLCIDGNLSKKCITDLKIRTFMLILNVTLECIPEPSKALVPVGYTNHGSPAPVWCSSGENLFAFV